ncbi:hypothetical protein G6F65_017892 [Rhizopus arrhizus]|uniref:Uncharacterized protein n=1 Tax=Rhizopus oryzae TaxID=64495 RepID=A0A9P7BII1_RHIOR|nr:hypothetical protein G6F24_015382 [Rhizopus arrhizus]KAG0922177.1 hypothetical protein G6F31_020015 [Rhizopus arrhizus]KAG1252508.1 hypothetical protein G6F65_017892 [Rhizopus arrhizus]KAG1273062.1 hypothetical protein G6F64_015421 [Rhizopus arrhizus]
MRVADDDGAFSLASSQSPLRIGAVDIAVGRSATITYLLRVGAGPAVEHRHRRSGDGCRPAAGRQPGVRYRVR